MTYYISDTSCFVFVYFFLLHHDSTLLCKEWIYLYENDITGPIPSSFGNLISIGKLIDYKRLYDFSTPIALRTPRSKLTSHLNPDKCY